MFNIGQRVRVRAHIKYISLSRGAVVTPPKQVRHPGYREAVYDGPVDPDDPSAGVAVIVFGDSEDVVPMSALEALGQEEGGV